MGNVILYIGTDQASKEHFGKTADEIAFVADVREAARTIRRVYKEGGDSGIIVLYESNGGEKEFAALASLKKDFPQLYLVLVTDKPFTPTERTRYLKCGINDTVSSRVSKEEFDTGLELIKKNQRDLLRLGGGGEKIASFRLPLWKRAFDVVASGSALLVLSPLLLAVAAAIKLESRGPVIYKSKRVGSNYHVFDFLKFRSMYDQADKHLKQVDVQNQYSTAEDLSATAARATQSVLPVGDGSEPAQPAGDVLLVSDDYAIPEPEYMQTKSVEQANAFVKFENDPRITRIGKFIRKYSIDELPQLVNILRGDMSVVGNRPLPLYEAEKLTADEYIDRFMAPAGLTGLWQVEKRGGAGKMSAEERKRLDIDYAKNFSFPLDIKILIKTFTAFIQKENV